MALHSYAWPSITIHGPPQLYITLHSHSVVSKTKTPKMKTRRPKTYENEDPLRKWRPLTKTKTPYENDDPLRKRRPPTKTKTLLFFCRKRNDFVGNEVIAFRERILILFAAARNLGSITSRCSGKEPALLPRTHGWTHGLSIVNFDQWDICLPESSRLHELSFSQ